MAAVPKRMARAECPVNGRAVLRRSRTEEPGRDCVPGRDTPLMGRPVEVRGLDLDCLCFC